MREGVGIYSTERRSDGHVIVETVNCSRFLRKELGTGVGCRQNQELFVR